MEREATNIDREFRMIEQSYGTDHLDLVLATGYLARLIENVHVVHHLARQHPELLAEFQRSEVHTSVLHSRMRFSYSVTCLKYNINTDTLIPHLHNLLTIK